MVNELTISYFLLGMVVMALLVIILFIKLK